MKSGRLSTESSIRPTTRSSTNWSEHVVTSLLVIMWLTIFLASIGLFALTQDWMWLAIAILFMSLIILELFS